MTAVNTYEPLPRAQDGDGLGGMPSGKVRLLWWGGNLMAWIGGGHWRDIADRHERSQFQISGFFVLFNGGVAWVLATLAVAGVAEGSPLDAAPYTVLWGVFVGAVDLMIARYIRAPRRGSHRHPRGPGAGLLMRAIMAVVLGVVIAEFASLAIFHNAIDSQLLVDQAKEVARSQSAIGQQQGTLNELIAERTKREQAVTDAQGAWTKANRLYLCERQPVAGCPGDGSITGVAGDGDQTRVRLKQVEDAQTALTNAKDARAAVQPWVTGGPPMTLDDQIAALQQQREGELQNAKAVGRQDAGIDARWRAMDNYTLGDPSAMNLRVALALLFIGLDLIPLMAKLMRGYTGHDDRVLLRRAIMLSRNAAFRDRHVAGIEAEAAHAEFVRSVNEESACEAVRLRARTDRALTAERERIRLEQETAAMHRAAAEELSRPAAPPPDPDAAEAAEPSVSDLVAHEVPKWWTGHDRELLKMTFGEKFKVIGPLVGASQGSFGRLLMARDLTADGLTDRAYVVIKAVRLPDEDKGGVGRRLLRKLSGAPERMWRREIMMATQLDHRGIGKIIAYGHEFGYMWTAAPHYRSGSLTNWISERRQNGNPPTLGQLLLFSEEIAAALEAAHRRQLLHGDLKPDNVVLDGPQPVVIDWGLARLLDKAEQDQSTGLPRGTRFFGAPEMFTASEPFDASEAPYADIWSLGATMYYLFAGEPPLARDVERIYPGETLGSAQIARLARQGRIAITALDELVPDAPSELAQLVQQMLAIVPAERAVGSEPWAAAAACRRAISHVAVLAARRDLDAVPVESASDVDEADVPNVRLRDQSPFPALSAPANGKRYQNGAMRPMPLAGITAQLPDTEAHRPWPSADDSPHAGTDGSVMGSALDVGPSDPQASGPEIRSEDQEDAASAPAAEGGDIPPRYIQTEPGPDI